MRDLEKYRGVIPGIYAWLRGGRRNQWGKTEALALHFLKKG